MHWRRRTDSHRTESEDFSSSGVSLWDRFSCIISLCSIPPYASMTASILLYTTLHVIVLQVYRFLLGFDSCTYFGYQKRAGKFQPTIIILTKISFPSNDCCWFVSGSFQLIYQQSSLLNADLNQEHEGVQQELTRQSLAEHLALAFVGHRKHKGVNLQKVGVSNY